MSSHPSERDPVEQLAEEFLERHRQGDCPPVSDYTRAHPELAEHIRDLFPAILLIEHLGAPREPAVPAGLPSSLGEYRILREIGRGGMGVVYEAVQEPLGRQVALKVLPLAGLVNPTHRERFQREARAAARLHHTNIVPVFGVGEQAGLHYYAMQLIHGQSLDAVLREVIRVRGQAVTVVPAAGGDMATSVAQGLHTGRWAPADSSPPPSPPRSRTDLASGLKGEYFRGMARIGVQVARALAYAHGQGILHRDIKPANLLLDLQGTVWVTDFGLAKMEGTEELTGTGDLIGTLRYMAPERFGGQADPRSDVYSLGVTLFELLTLRPAFTETGRPELMRQVLHEDPPRPCQLDSRIPRDLETIVCKALAREPRERYQTAELLADDLERFLSGRPIQARRTPLPERCWRWCRRNPWLAGLAALAAVLFLVIVIGSPLMLLRLWEQRQQAREELWGSRLAQAEAQRLSNQPGRRFGGLRTLDVARELLPSLRAHPARVLALRNQYIALLSVPDLGAEHGWQDCPVWSAGVAFDARLEHCARSDGEGNISVRRVADNQELARLPGAGLPAWSLRFSPDARFLAAGYQLRHQTAPRQVLVWDCQQRTVAVRVESATGCSEAGFSPDSRLVALGRDEKTMTIYDLAAPGKPGKDLTLGARPVYLVFHPTGRKLAISQPSGVEVRDPDTGKVLASWPHGQEVRGLAWRPDGKLLAVAAGFGIHFRWEDSSEPPPPLHGHEGLVTEVAFSPDGELLASKGHDGTVRLWDMAARRELVCAPRIDTGCSSLHFSPDGRQLGFASDGVRLWVWEVARGRECRTLRVHQTGSWQSMMGSFTTCGRLLAIGRPRGIHLLDWAAGRESFLAFPEAWSVLFSADGKQLFVTGGQGLYRWPINPAAEKGKLRFGPAEPVYKGEALTAASLSRDGRTVVACRRAGGALVVDVSRPAKPLVIADHAQLAYVAVSPDGQRVATGTWYGTGVKVWDTANGTLLREVPVQGSAAVAFSPDGEELVVAADGEYTFWDLNSWQQRRAVGKEREIRPGDVAYTEDGSLLAVRQSAAQLWLVDPATGEQLAEVQPPSQQTVLWHCLSRDGRRLAAACRGGAIHVWDLELIRGQLAQRGLDW